MPSPDLADQQPVAADELDVRPMRKPDKHPLIFKTFDALAVGQSFVLINDHDPRHLRDEFEADYAGSFDWEYLHTGVRNWRIRITKLTSTPLPRILANTTEFSSDTGRPDVAGAAWKLQIRQRDLDSNVIALPPGESIASHLGPDLDVLVHVLAGSGQLTTELGTLDLAPGALVWLPRCSRRRIDAGRAGLRYLTVHKRRKALVLGTSPNSAG